jgi:hypothetical protein
MVRAIRVWLRHDLWRPASWLAAVMAAAGSAATVLVTPLVVVLVVIPAAVVTAVGEVPASIPQWQGVALLNRRGWRRVFWPEPALPGALAWLALRLVWPLAGWVSGPMWAGLFLPSGLEDGNVGVLAAGLVAGLMGIALAGVLLAGFLVAGLTAADAATATLVSGWLAAGGAAQFAQESGFLAGLGGLLVGSAGWLLGAAILLAVFCWLSSLGGEPLVGRLPRTEPPASTRVADRLVFLGLLGVLPARSPWRRFLRAVIMVGLLAGMVAWLLLLPEASAWFAVLALLSFGGLAIPVAALLDGRQVRQGWVLLAAATARGPWWRCPALPTVSIQVAVVFAGHAAVVLWPPLVVAAVAAGGPAATAAVSVAASVAGGVGVVSVGCFLATRAGVRGETVQAIGLCLLACGLWGVWVQQFGGSFARG